MKIQLRFLLQCLLLMGFSVFWFACSATKGANSNSSCMSAPCATEPDYCSTISTPANPVTITGTANYIRRHLDTAGVSGGGLRGTDAARPIRFAEVAIYNSSGQVIQCGETTTTGTFSIAVENSSSPITVQVRSRADNNKVKISVLNDHQHMNFYSIQSSSVVPNQNRNVGSFSAPYSGTLEGGAFNIMDTILSVNEYLRANSGDVNFVAPKVTALWKPGFNPASYLGSSNSLSYYMNGTGRLYILGGSNNNVCTADTDHFDNTIIVHEYGHFLEDKIARSDSPGGSHDANSVIDPRLAWSEGWATFLAITVLNNPYYEDTYGNGDAGCSTGYAFVHTNQDINSPKRDPDSAYVVPAGQGVFREFGVVRALVDAVDVNGTVTRDADGVNAPFSEIWTTFSSASGWKNGMNAFRNPGLFLKIFYDLGGSDISGALLPEKMCATCTSSDNFVKNYALPANSNFGACGSTASIQPKDTNNVSEDGSFSNSNQFSSNNFYRYDHPGGAFSVTLTHSGGLDLDLYLYKEHYTYGETSSILAYSNNSGSASESLSAPNLPAGVYMINVMAYTGDLVSNGTLQPWPTGTYTLKINGSTVCP